MKLATVRSILGEPKLPAITLADIVTAPNRVGELSRTEAIAMLNQIAALQSAVAAHLLAIPAETSTPAAAGPDDLITRAEAARILCKSEKWILRHPKLPFRRKIGRSVMCSKAGVLAWADAQRLR